MYKVNDKIKCVKSNEFYDGVVHKIGDTFTVTDGNVDMFNNTWNVDHYELVA